MSKHSLRLGGGNWAAKEDKILAYAEGDISGKFLPHEMDFSRGADIGATRFNKEGLIEKGRENMFTYSNDFRRHQVSPAPWGHNGLATYYGPESNPDSIPNGEQGYDGSGGASFLLSSTNDPNDDPPTSVHRISLASQNSTAIQTFSIYAKALGYKWLAITTNSGTMEAYFDLENGELGTVESNVIEAKMVDAGNGWYRCSMTVNSSVAVTSIGFGISDGDENHVFQGNRDQGGTNRGGIYIQDAQWELGLVPTEYMHSATSTTGKAGQSEDMPRIDYRKGDARLLLESYRVNLARVSEGTPLGGKNNVTLTKYYGVAPDGLKTSLKVTKSQDANDRIRIETTGGIDPLDTSIRYTISAFVKNIDCTGATTLGSRMDDDTLTPYLYRQAFRWDGDHIYVYNGNDAGNSGTRHAAFAEDYGNGWWRIGFTFLPNDTTASFELDIDRLSATANTVSSIETWGWQFEKREGATSYIPTYGVKAGRNFDEIEMIADQSTDGVMGNYNTTFYMEVENNGGTHNQLARFITLENADNDQDPRVLLYADPETNEDTWELKLQYRANAGSLPADVYVNKTGFNYNEKVKILGRIDGTEMASFANGLKNGTATITTQDDIEDIDFSNLSSDQNHHISDIQIFPFSLTDTDAFILTSKETYATFADMSETLKYSS